MTYLTDWLNANKIWLNVKKSELAIFKHKDKKTKYPIKIKLSEKRLYPSKSVKYFGVEIDKNLNWKDQTHVIATTLNRPNNYGSLKATYVAIFDSHINFANLIWGQNPNPMLRIITLQKKSAQK